MATEVVMPRQGNTVESCLIVSWSVAVGDSVSRGDVLCEVETDKSTIEVVAEDEGTVLLILAEEGDDVPVQQTILVLGESGEDVSAFETQSPSTASTKDAPVESVTTASETVEPAAVVQSSASASAPAAQISRDAGEFIAISPRARKAAEKAAVDFTTIAGTGPGGRILEKDILAVAAANPAVSAAARNAGISAGASGSGIGGRPRSGDSFAVAGSGQSAASAVGAVSYGEGEVTKVPSSGIRKVIAARMRESLATTAQFTLNSSADARSIQAWRASYKKSPESYGLSGITLGDMVMFACSRVLTSFPEMNSSYIDGVLHMSSEVHLGFAVDTPRGLMVPVIKNANRKSLKQISDETRSLAQACKDGNISPDLLSGGTFTVSNLGNYGVESFSPVLNAPQVGILGVCAIQPGPRMEEGEVVWGPRMGFSLTIDHQAVDGGPAARFLQEYCRFLENFELAAAL